MRKIILLCLICTYNFYFSQLKMDIEIIDRKENNEYVLSIKLINESKNNYVVPIDTIGYKTYMSDNRCSGFYRIKNYPDLGFIPKIIEENGCFLEIRGSSIGVSDDNINIQKEIEQIKIENTLHNEELKKWKNKYNIKKNIKQIDINKYIYNNLVEIKSGETITYIKKINLQKMNFISYKYSYDYYLLERKKVYTMFLEICIERRVYNYLTTKQKDKFKNFIFYHGKILSNGVNIETL